MKMYKLPREGDLKEIKIEVTRNCSLNCVHCSSIASPDNPLQLSKETVLSLIEQAAVMGVTQIVLSGGEPLLWPWIEDAVNCCAKEGIECTLYSTGINHNGTGGQKLIALHQRGLNKVVFSLYAPIKDIHEKITRKSGSYEGTISAMKITEDSKLEREIHFVPIKINYKYLYKLIDFAEKHGVMKISILRFVPHGRGAYMEEEALTHRETMELRDLIISCRKKFRGVIRLGSPYNILMLNEYVDCIAAQKVLIILPNGNIYPCDAFKNIEPDEIDIVDSYNNILHHSLRECWENSKYLNVIRGYLSTPFEEPCVSCIYINRCKSGCLAQKVIDQKSILNGKIIKRPDPLCIRHLLGGQYAKGG